MEAGMIIQFYRKKVGMTQEELGEGICSATHISKIERGLTEFSGEITDMLADRLDIKLERELYYLSNIKKKLDMWHDAMVNYQMGEAAEIWRKLKKNPLLGISDYQIYYQLLEFMYLLKQNLSEYWKIKAQKIPTDVAHLSAFEQNLSKHVWGIYYIQTGEQDIAIQHMKAIEFDHYSNGLVYFDFAVAYYYDNSRVLSYYYAEKALQLFKQKNNFLGIIDAENLMIIQIGFDNLRDFKETEEQFNNLLRICDAIHSMDNKGKLLHNFAYENFRRENYLEAAMLYKQSMDLKEKQSENYLLSLEGYIRSGYHGGFATKEELLLEIHEGLKIAKTLDLTLYILILNVHKYAILEKQTDYYRYIHEKAVPYFKENGYFTIAKRYEKELFIHYDQMGEKDVALEIARGMIQAYTNTEEVIE